MADTSIINNARPKPAEWDEYDASGKWIGLSDAEFHGPHARPREGGGDAVATTTGTAPAPAAEAPAADRESGPRRGGDTKHGEVPEYQPPTSSGGIMDWLSGIFGKSQDPIWPTSNRIGTDTLNDVRGQDTFTPPPVASTPGLDEAQAGLARAPNTEYGKVLPYAEDTETGERRLAMPDMARDYLKGLLDLISGPTTGYVSPDASMVLAQRALTTPPGEAGTLYAAAAGGSKRAAREAATAERAAGLEGKTALDKVIQTSSPRSQELAAYERTVGQTVANAETKSTLINGDAPIISNLIGDVGSPEALARAAAGEAERVSTRIPTAVAKKGQEAPVDPHTVANFNIGIDALRNSEDTYTKNTTMMKDSAYKKDSGWLNGMPRYPDLPLNNATTPDEISEASIEHMKDNLLWLHSAMSGQFGPEMVERASRWYDGANAIAHDLAQKTGLMPRQVAAAMANLSPQKDWFQNVDLAKRLIDIHMNRQDTPFTPEMAAWSDRYLAGAAKDIEKDRVKGKNIDKRLAAFQKTTQLFDQLKQSGATYGSLNATPELRALWARAYDEAYNPKDYQILTPEGFSAGRVSTNADGSKQKIAWGSFDEIRKAIDVLSGDGSLQSISQSLGGNHKVRSFYNNIIAPNSTMGDSTMDTHAIAAGHLRPLGSGDDVVGAGLGLSPGSSRAETGNKGMYAVYHEAYRRAAEQLGVLPRQMQSIVWEGVRGFFLPAQKRDNAFVADINAIWQGFRDGQYDANQARHMILQRTRGNSGLVAPSWWTPEEPDDGR